MTATRVWMAAPGAPRYPAFDGSQLCAQTDPELFHPSEGNRAPEAKKTCRRCPWLDECLEWAIWQDVDGIWGGTNTAWRRTERQRRGIPSPVTEKMSQYRDLIIAAGSMVLAKDLARQLGCTERTVERYQAELRRDGSAA